MKPKVSIITPVLNEEKYIAETIESVLAQTYPHYELIIVNDGSTDGTYSETKPYLDRIKYVAHPTRKGVCAALNTGLAQVSGELVAFLDGNDLWLPDKLTLQVDYLEKNPDVGLVHSDYQTFNDRGVIEESAVTCRNLSMPSGHVFKELFLRSFICANTVVIRKECCDRLGGFDETLYTGDIHMWLRIARYYKIGYVGKVLSKYRQHSTQFSRDFDRSAECAIAVVKKISSDYPEIVNELGKNVIAKRIADIYFDTAYAHFTEGNFPSLRKAIVKAIRIWPWSYRYYLLYAVSFL